ncbi:MAG TPA: ABC transporter ATP-binding protein [Gemmatimonadaceae bacterium]|nr:ABC transporter ATP-binding protein [Gemmatimonadaceae bacterium]
MIELREVHRRYRKGADEIRALDGVSLAIGKGELVAVMGPSGSGKSTLMNIMGLLDRPDSGAYLLDGRDVAELSPDEKATVRNERIGFVFQAFHLLPGTTALENVELPLVYAEGDGGPGRGLRALERVGLADRARHLPNELSGGQQQRVAIARALVQEPDVILADEPTGNLDSTSSAEIMDIFRRLNEQGTTVVVITHNEEVARQAERTVAIVDGRIRSDFRKAAAALALGGAGR